MIGVAVVLTGCDVEGQNFSPNALDDPARAARAQAQAVEVERQNREAEAAFYQRLRVEQEPEIEEDGTTKSLSVE